MAKVCTHVYELPDEKDARARFLGDLDALIKLHGVEVMASSTHDEMTYAERLEDELEEQLGSFAKEQFRQSYEREGRMSVIS